MIEKVFRALCSHSFYWRFSYHQVNTMWLLITYFRFDVMWRKTQLINRCSVLTWESDSATCIHLCDGRMTFNFFYCFYYLFLQTNLFFFVPITVNELCSKLLKMPHEESELDYLSPFLGQRLALSKCRNNNILRVLKHRSVEDDYIDTMANYFVLPQPTVN